jgi:hypothetical protein
MARRKRNQELLREQCSRVTALLSLVDQSEAAIGRALGHANASTLSRVREGKSFLDSETLARLGTLDVRGLAVPNLHWVLTGTGSPVLAKPGQKPSNVEALCQLASLGGDRKSRSRETVASK